LAWLSTWGAHVADADMEGARPLFDPSVLGFGTRAEVADGLDRLLADQWSQVWPAITGFRFDVDDARTWVSPDGRQGVIATRWHSEGRRGRATVVLHRGGEDDRWRAVHTHFSLTPA
jgi:hypothetical protein